MVGPSGLGLTCNALLLLCIGLRDVEASSCQLVFHRKVGDTVEFSSCSSPEGLSMARWKYGGSIIAGKDIGLPSNKQFGSRLDLNPTNFSLTVRRLTLQDSGDYSFISSKPDGEQRDTTTITLHVHEPLTSHPKVSLDPTWHASNQSCTFLLRCNSSDDNVNYTWTVRNKNTRGSSLQYIATPQEGEIEFKCTINNFISEMSESVTPKCSNNTQEIKPREEEEKKESKGKFILILCVAVGGCLLVVIIVGVAVGVHSWRKSQTGSETNDLTVYADITEVTADAGTMKPSSEYETIGHSVNTVTPKAQTVYDKIQFSRVREETVSPYQDVS